MSTGEKFTRRRFLTVATTALSGLLLPLISSCGGERPPLTESDVENVIKKLNELIQSGDQYVSFSDIPDSIKKEIYTYTAQIIRYFYEWEGSFDSISERIVDSNTNEMVKLSQDVDVMPYTLEEVKTGLGGKTYPAQDGNMAIAIHSESPLMTLSVLQDQTKRQQFPDLPINVVENLFRLLSHELHHFAAGLRKFDTIQKFRSEGNSVYTYTASFGFALHGANGLGRRVQHFGDIDEIAIALLQNPIHAKITAANQTLHSTDLQQLSAAMQEYFFNKIGADTPQKIDALHKDPRGGMIVLIEKIQEVYSLYPNEAYQLIVKVSSVLSKQISTADKVVELQQAMEQK
jgi:hypothetical protein